MFRDFVGFVILALKALAMCASLLSCAPHLVTLNDPPRHPELVSGSATQPSRSHILSVACFHWTRRVTIQASLHSGLRIAPVGISALFASVGSQPRLSYVAYQQLRFRPAQRGSQTHSGSRIRYGLRALRQAPRLPLSHFAHQSARLRSLSAVALNSLGLRVPIIAD